MKIAILLDGSQSNYIVYAGQIVSGNVRVETKDEIKLRGIRLEVLGNTKVQFSETKVPSADRIHTCDETLIDSKMYLTGSDIDSEIVLTPGDHTFPLSFVLPDTVPSSFAGSYGYIRYKLKAVVNRINRLDESTEVPIIVIRTLNLNNEPPEVKVPVVVQVEKPMVGCCVNFCCMRGHTDIELRINRGCFVPGETMILNGKVVNKSNTRIKKATINFVQEVEYIMMTPGGLAFALKHQCETLDSTKLPQIESGSTDSWTNVSFTVPPAVASRLDGSNIINISYFIRVKVDFAKGCAHSEIRKDIVIGHIPLQGDTQFIEPITTQPSTYTSPFQSVTAPNQEESSHSGVHGEG